jgi:hypothetical protein
MRFVVAVLALASALLVTGCGSAATSPGGSPDDPVTHGPGDPAGSGASDLLADTTGEAPFSVDTVSVRVAESFPVQLFLDVTGHAPTPCHRIAYTIEERHEEISVAITTTSSGESCAQVLQPHEIVIPLGSADLPITVRVNDGEHVETVSP